MKPAPKTYLAPTLRSTNLRVELAFLQLSTVDTADNKYNPENDLGELE